MVGNKGGIAYSFVFRDKLFNVIGCHLKHGQDKSIKRDEMMSALVSEFKL
jgi:hypothetical protein